MPTTVVQVSNICGKATPQQLHTLFNICGNTTAMRTFRDEHEDTQVCFVEFETEDDAKLSLHLNNTFFLDRSIAIRRAPRMPLDSENLMTSAGGLLPTPGAGVLALGTASGGSSPSPLFVPAAIPPLNPSLVPQQPVPAVNPSLLEPSVDPAKLAEIRRTIYVGNIGPGVSRDEITAFFATCGPISYVRITGDESQPSRFAFVEFVDENSVNHALALNGKMLVDRPAKVGRSKNAIVKPPQLQAKPKSREVDHIQRKLEEAQARILMDILGDEKKQKSPSGGAEGQQREGARSRSRSRSRSPRRRSRSRSPRRRHERRRSRSRSRSRSPRRSRSSRHEEDERSRRRHRSSREHERRDEHDRREHRSSRDDERREHRSSREHDRRERRPRESEPAPEASPPREHNGGEERREGAKMMI